MSNAPSDPPVPVLPGEMLAGKYRVERLLGQGGMGVVVLATHVQLEQRVAIKFLLPQAVQNPDAVARFAREARAATKIQSEHVVRVTDVGTLETGAPYMVMEYLEGQDLAQVLEVRGTLHVEEAIDYLLQATEAIAEAHAAGIVHRDLKPANIYLTRRADGSPVVKVLDFGISKVTSPKGLRSDPSMTRTSALMGSPVYMSPEQMKSTRDVDARTDIWALGIILHELLAGGPVFMADTIPQLCAMILGDPPPALTSIRADVPRGVEAVVLRCLEKDPARRFQNVAELAVALGPFAPPQAHLSIDRVIRIIRATGVQVDAAPRSHPPAPSSYGPRAYAQTESHPSLRPLSNASDRPPNHPMTPATMSSFSGTNGGVRRPKTAIVAVLVGAMLAAGAAGAFVLRARAHAPTLASGSAAGGPNLASGSAAGGANLASGAGGVNLASSANAEGTVNGPSLAASVFAIGAAADAPLASSAPAASVPAMNASAASALDAGTPHARPSRPLAPHAKPAPAKPSGGASNAGASGSDFGDRK